MLENESSERLLAASRLTGADILFLHLVEVVAAKVAPIERDQAARQRIEALHEDFRRRCAEIFERQLGTEQALQSLAALETAPLQRYLAARHAMAPALGYHLGELEKRMGNLEL
jgi:hypothetical protein